MAAGLCYSTHTKTKEFIQQRIEELAKTRNKTLKKQGMNLISNVFKNEVFISEAFTKICFTSSVTFFEDVTTTPSVQLIILTTTLKYMLKTIVTSVSMIERLQSSFGLVESRCQSKIRNKR